MIAALVALAVALALIGLGQPLIRRIGRDLSPAEQWLAAPLVGALPLAALVGGIGGVTYTPLSMGVLLTGTAGLGLWVLVRKGARLPRPAGHPLMLAALALVALALIGAYSPPSDHDTIRYHLSLPRRDLELGQITSWFGWSIYEFFPPLASNLTHLAYATGGASAAQLLNVEWMVLAMGWAALLAARLGGGPAAIAAAALLFAAQRVVINLGSAVTVDIPLAAYACAAMVVALILCEHKQARLTLLLGLLVGGLLGIKYHGGIVAAAMLAVFAVAALSCRRSPWPFVSAGALGLALITPILVRNGLITGNPIFPTLHQHFGAGNMDIFAPLQAALMAREVIPGGVWALPWSMHIHQNAFDGLQFGFPFTLAAIPFAFFHQTRQRVLCLMVWAVYGVLWWLVMPHLLRFQLPLLGVAAALAALGLEQMAATARRVRALMPVWLVFLAVGAMVQGLFVASTALHRLPSALGRVTTEQALEAPAFVYYSLVSPCRWIEARLQPGERYLALINDPSFYCPQASALPGLTQDEAAAFYTRTPPPPVSAAELARRLEAGNVRYVLMAANLGSDDEPYVFAKHRFDAAAQPALARLTPLLSSPSGMVYDGPALAKELTSRQP